MLLLGICGGLDFPYENELNFQTVDLHDAAAVLVKDGKVLAAIEEERLNRIKHSNKSSLFSAAKFVLDSQGYQLSDVDKICYYSTEDFANYMLKSIPRRQFIPIRQRLLEKIQRSFGTTIQEDKLCFVHHHLAHAMSTYAMSGFDKSLVLTIDESGDGIAGMVLKGEDGKLEVLEEIPRKYSLGRFYADAIGYLGFKIFDEYKVMGLAPYGNPDTYRDVFRAFYQLLPNGQYKTMNEYFNVLNNLDGIPRKKGEEFTQVHMDVAAALQEALEKIVFHKLEYYKETLGLDHLCLAGGVAQNCTLNGKLLYAGTFKDMFVQPASYDAGTALGAALYEYYANSNGTGFGGKRLQEVYWGRDIGANGDIETVLSKWDRFLDIRKSGDVTADTAKALADGSVVGWVQGRSEFGPRALGNRSILADPRPAENKDIINAMVKKREAFRPFAPSVLEEYVDEYYVAPDSMKQFPFMTFVLDVKEDKQKILGAVTHVDGTARIQSVSKKTNPKYWRLIDEFRKLTGIPVVLNTSFNNNVEPIVDSVEDAITCYLTTKLNTLVVGDYIMTKKEVDYTAYLDMTAHIPLHVELNSTRKSVSADEVSQDFEIRDNYIVASNAMMHGVIVFSDLSHGLVKSTVSKTMYRLLSAVDGKKTVRELFTGLGVSDEAPMAELVDELVSLWTLRLVRLRPAG